MTQLVPMIRQSHTYKRFKLQPDLQCFSLVAGDGCRRSCLLGLDDGRRKQGASSCATRQRRYIDSTVMVLDIIGNRGTTESSPHEKKEVSAVSQATDHDEFTRKHWTITE